MKTNFNSSILLLTVGIGTLVIALMAFMGQVPRQKNTNQRTFSSGDVARIKQSLRNVDPKTYRIVLPAFLNGQVVGSKTYGTLSMSQVRQVASARQVVINERGNLQLVMDPNEAGMSSGANTTSPDPKTTTQTNPTNGPNSMHTTSTGKLIKLLDQITRNIDQGQFVFLKPVASTTQLKQRVQKQ